MAEEVKAVFERRSGGPEELEKALAQELKKLQEVVGAFSRSQGILPELGDEINLALDELITNAISYGAGQEPRDLRIELALRREGEDVIMSLADDGVPFDPTRRPDPDIDAPLEERQVGGLGIYFARKLTSRMAYRREGGRNILELVKRVGAPDPSGDPAAPGESA